MSKRLLDDSFGVSEFFHYDANSDTTIIETVQDVEPHIEFAKKVRNDPEITKKGIKGNWWHFAHLPDSIILKMKFEDGVDIYDQNDWPRIGKLIEEKYPAFKFTDGKHKFKA